MLSQISLEMDGLCKYVMKIHRMAPKKTPSFIGEIVWRLDTIGCSVKPNFFQMQGVTFAGAPNCSVACKLVLSR